jgi:hypothetical protein
MYAVKTPDGVIHGFTLAPNIESSRAIFIGVKFYDNQKISWSDLEVIGHSVVEVEIVQKESP